MPFPIKTMPFRRTTKVYVMLAAVFACSWWASAQGSLQVGYTLVRLNSGTGTPVGSAVFSFTNPDGILVTEAGVGAVVPVASGRIFVDDVGTRTGIAMVNSATESQVVNLTLRDVTGALAGQTSLVMNPGQHVARFADELFTTGPGFRGSLSFESPTGLGAITLRLSENGFAESVYTTLPVVNLSAPATSAPLVFPHLAAGGGFKTQILLINPSSAAISGRIRLIQSDGTPLVVDWDGAPVSENGYQIEANGVYRAELTSAAAAPAVGYAVLTPDVGVAPSGSVVFQLFSGTDLVTEAGVGVTAETTRARISLDNVGRQTGVAIANRYPQAAEVQFILEDRFGTEQKRISRTIPAGGHLARMAQELFPDVTSGFSGMIQIQSTIPVAPIMLQLTINSRSAVVLTTLPVADLNRAQTSSLVVFPQIVIGSGFETRLVFMNGDAAQIDVEFHAPDGTAMTVPIGTETSNQFTFSFAANEGQRLFPGDTATVSSVSLRDPVTNAPTSEVTVTEGTTIRPRVLVIDNTGKARDEVGYTLTSLDTTAATITNGQITGNRRGFSTLTITSGQTVTSATITVVGVESGTSGAFGTGITQDPTGRVYLASTSDHTVIRAESISTPSAVYAGQRQQAGLTNGLRLASEFSSPAFLTLDQARGNLYVSDSANHVIRTVGPGPNGVSATLAGSGSAGSSDGIMTAAAFSSPQGVALDNRGHLWIADQGNHTIRRINLVTGQVDTIAGLAGQSGATDGQGAAARFNRPTGISIEPEATAAQLARELRGEPPPPIRVVVADTGNGLVRRIDDTGTVTTLRASASTSAITTGIDGARPMETMVGAPLSFDSPTGIAADVYGNIYVTDPDRNDVRTVLPGGQLVSAVPLNTLVRPEGIVVTRSGKVVVSDSGQPLREITFGAPVIDQITPGTVALAGGTTVTIRGRNFGPGTLAVIAGVVVQNPTIVNTETISFVTPPLPSGRTTLTVQNRGGLAQKAFQVETIPFGSVPAAFITTFAGGSTFAGDGGPATAAPIRAFGVAVDSAGHLYIADTLKSRVRRVDRTTGVITTVAGNGLSADTGDNGLATAAALDNPNSVAFDTAGHLYIADTFNGRVRKVSIGTQIITTVAGGGESGLPGDGGAALEATLFAPLDIALDRSGNLFIADGYVNRVRRVDAVTGIITTYAGTGVAGYSGDGGSAVGAMMNLPIGLDFDASGNLLIADTNNNRIRKVDVNNGIITTIVGTGVASFSGDGGLASDAGLWSPSGVSVDGSGNLFIADDGNGVIRKVAVDTNLISTVAGNRSFQFSGDGGPAVEAGLNSASALTVDSGGNLFIADVDNRRIRRVDSATQVISTFAGGNVEFLGDGGRATEAVLTVPIDIEFDAQGNLFVVDETSNRVRRIDANTGVITTVAGGAEYPETGLGDGGLATDAPLSAPVGIAFDANGNLFIADTWHHQVRKVDAVTGIITRVAGTGVSGFQGDGGSATAAQLNAPEALATSEDGLLYVADSDNFRVRRIDLDTGVITTVVGTGVSGYSGDGGPATSAAVSYVSDIEVDSDQDLLIVDSNPNSVIRKVDIETGVITTIAGGGALVEDGVPAIDSLLHPLAIAEYDDELFLVDILIQGVRLIDDEGDLWVVAGSGITGSGGDGGPANSAEFAFPRAIQFDAEGNLYVSDSFNNRIRVIRGPLD